MPVDRRDFLKWSGLAMLIAGGCAQQPHAGKADYTLRIATSQVEVAPGKLVSTTTYNGQFPGPLIRIGCVKVNRPHRDGGIWPQRWG